MSNQEILNLLRCALSEVAPRHAHAAQGLHLESSLIDLGLDSLCVTAMAGHVEDILDIQLPDDELASVLDVPSFIAAVRRHLEPSLTEITP
jgi:acyl carrier protein